MRKDSAILALVVSLLVAIACEDGATNVASTPTPFGQRVPNAVANLPEGALIVQDESPIGYPRFFALGRQGAEQIGKGPSISVSPDGRALAAVEWDSDYSRWRIRLLSVDGEEQAVIELAPAPTAVNAGIPYLLWSADGERLAYTVADEDQTDKSQVYVVDSDGSGQRRVTSAPDYYSPIGWTSEGRLLISAPGRLLLGGERTEEMPLPANLAQGGSTLSPDGTKAAIQAGDYEEGLELWLLDLDTQALRLLADMGGNVRTAAEDLYVFAGVPPVARARSTDLLLKGPPPVIWSPDSSRIAYLRSLVGPSSAVSSELRVVDVGSGEDILITEEGGWLPAWSPDGRYLVAPTETSMLLRDSQGQTRNFDMPYALKQATWSSSGTLVAITAAGIRLIDPETAAERSAVAGDGKPVYGGNAAYGQWVWSPSGRYLAFSTISDQYTKGSVYMLDSNSGTATLVLDRQAFVPVGWLAGD